MDLFGDLDHRAEGARALDANRAHRLEQLYASGVVPRSGWVAPKVSELPSWRDAKMVGVDVETRDPDIFSLGCGARREGCYVVAVSFAIEDGPAYYLPVAHGGGGNMDADKVWQYLRDQARDFRGEFAAADAMYEEDWLLNYGVDLTKHKMRCVLTCDALLDEHSNSYRYDDVLARRGFPPKDESRLRKVADALGLDPKGDLWQFPAEAVAEYGVGDVRNLVPLYRKQKTLAEADTIWPAVELESDLIPVLVHQRRWGIPVDEQELLEVERWAQQGMAERFERFYAATGQRVGREVLGSGKQLQKVCDALGLGQLPLTDGGDPSASEEAFDSIEHPAFAPLVQAKKLDKLINTYVKGTRKHIVRGRVHPTIKSVRGSRDNRKGSAKGKEEGTTSRRTAGGTPNIQNQPNPLKAESNLFLVELGTRWRRVYKADKSKFWAMADLAQQEPKWTVHYALMRKLPGALEAAERWRADPSLKLAKLVGEMTGLDYGLAKIWFLARCYGAGGAKLARALGLPTVEVWSRRRGKMIDVAGPEADEIIKKCDALVPYVPALLQECIDQVKANGCIQLKFLDWSKIRFEWNHVENDYHRIYKALNALAQGSAAVQLKMILLALAAAGIPAQTTVHDDVSRSCETMEEAQYMREIAENAVPAEVPWYAKLLCGPSFGDACVAKETPHAQA